MGDGGVYFLGKNAYILYGRPLWSGLVMTKFGNFGQVKICFLRLCMDGLLMEGSKNWAFNFDSENNTTLFKLGNHLN